MSSEEPKPFTGEIVAADTQIAKTQSSSVEDLSQSEEGLVVLERGIEIMKVLRAASIALTYPHDWVLFKAEDRITGYCQDAGCQRFSDIWGIEIYNLSDWDRTEDPETKDFSWTITGDGLSKRTGQTVVGISGTRYSYEDFIVRRRLPRLQIETEVKKAARANLHGSIVRELAGMKAVPVEELDQVWSVANMGAYKNSKLCPKGRGFGSQAERQGAQIQQSDDLKPGEEPFCQQCDPPVKMKFVPGGVSRNTNKPYAAFWSCVAKGQDHKTIPHETHMKGVMERRQASSDAQR